MAKRQQTSVLLAAYKQLARAYKRRSLQQRALKVFTRLMATADGKGGD